MHMIFHGKMAFSAASFGTFHSVAKSYCELVDPLQAGHVSLPAPASYLL